MPHWPWRKRQPLEEQVRTSLGLFRKSGHGWEGTVTRDGSELTVHADDIEGAPDEAFLRRVAAILPDLPRIEAATRASVERISPAHRLDLVENGEPQADLTLGFSYNEEVWDETVFVDLRHGNVVGWCVVD